jgi:hypothetical protein
MLQVREVARRQAMRTVFSMLSRLIIILKICWIRYMRD